MLTRGLDRRTFVKTAAVGLAAPYFIPASSFGRGGRVGPNERIGLGFIGCGKRAGELMDSFLQREDVRVIAVCDVDTKRREHMRKLVMQKDGMGGGFAACAAENDYRELLGNAAVDAVVISTPDHWHASQVIDSAKAGKDIYCEKPLSLNVREAKAMIDAVRKHDRVFQTGSQQRTEFGGRFVKACEFVRSGRIGQIVCVQVGVPTKDKVGCTSVPCDLPEEKVEEGLDWDRWLGPAPMRGYNSVLSPRGVHDHYPDWRLYREYSGGMLTDFGAHHFDIAQWGLDMDKSGPVWVEPPADGKSGYGARLRYASGIEVIHGGPTGITFVGSEGQLWVNRDETRANPDSIIKDEIKEGEVRLPRAKSHIDNWIECVRSRSRPICDIEVGARSVACCHLTNLAYWHRRALKWDPVKWEFSDDAEANGWRDYKDRRRAGYELPSA